MTLTIAKKIVEHCEKLKDYPLFQIYNVDENCLFYELVFRRTYVFQSKWKWSV